MAGMQVLSPRLQLFPQQQLNTVATQVEGNGHPSSRTPPPVKKEHVDLPQVTPTSTSKPRAMLAPGHTYVGIMIHGRLQPINTRTTPVSPVTNTINQYRFPSQLVAPCRAQIEVYKALRKGSTASSINQDLLATSINIPRVVDSARPTDREQLHERANNHPHCRHQGEPLYYLTAGARDHRGVAAQYLPEVRFELMPPVYSLPGPVYDDVPALIEDEYQRLVRFSVQRKQQQAEARSQGELVAGFTARDGKVVRDYHCCCCCCCCCVHL